MKHSTLISRKTDGLETITDKDTGQVFHVVRRDIKDGVETLVAVSSELSLQTTSVGVRDKYAFDNFYSGKMLTGLMKSKALNISESSVLGFLLENMSSGCKIQVSQSVISESISTPSQSNKMASITPNPHHLNPSHARVRLDLTVPEPLLTGELKH